MARDPALLRAVHRATARFTTGVVLLTARDASLSDWGITVGAFLPLSTDPPLVAVALRAEAGSTRAPTGWRCRSWPPSTRSSRSASPPGGPTASCWAAPSGWSPG